MKRRSPKRSGNTTSNSVVSKKAEAQPDPIVEAYKWLINGHDKADVIEALSKQFPAADPQQTIVAALEAFAVSIQEPTELIKGFCLEALRMLYQKSLAAGDYAGALACIKEIIKLNDSHKAHLELNDYISAISR